MANSTALSTALSALAESVAPALTGQPMPAPAQLYAAIIRARDEAHCLEARAADRDASVQRLLAQLKDTADQISPPFKGGAGGRVTASTNPPGGEPGISLYQHPGPPPHHGATVIFRSRFAKRIVE